MGKQLWGATMTLRQRLPGQPASRWRRLRCHNMLHCSVELAGVLQVPVPSIYHTTAVDSARPCAHVVSTVRYNMHLQEHYSRDRTHVCAGSLQTPAQRAWVQDRTHAADPSSLCCRKRRRRALQRTHHAKWCMTAHIKLRATLQIQQSLT